MSCVTGELRMSILLWLATHVFTLYVLCLFYFSLIFVLKLSLEVTRVSQVYAFFCSQASLSALLCSFRECHHWTVARLLQLHITAFIVHPGSCSRGRNFSKQGKKDRSSVPMGDDCIFGELRLLLSIRVEATGIHLGWISLRRTVTVSNWSLWKAAFCLLVLLQTLSPSPCWNTLFSLKLSGPITALYTFLLSILLHCSELYHLSKTSFSMMSTSLSHLL